MYWFVSNLLFYYLRFVILNKIFNYKYTHASVNTLGNTKNVEWKHGRGDQKAFIQGLLFTQLNPFEIA